MTIPDELLVAYIDGELEGAERLRVEQAIAQDAQLAQRVAQQRALRERVRGAFDGVMQEAVPQRRAQAAKLGAPSGPAQVIDLARVRAERARRGTGQRNVKMRRFTIAASLVVGVMAGALIQRLSAPGALTQFHDGSLLAHGALAHALNEQLAASWARLADSGIPVAHFEEVDGPIAKSIGHGLLNYFASPWKTIFNASKMLAFGMGLAMAGALVTIALSFALGSSASGMELVKRILLSVGTVLNMRGAVGATAGAA